jgi:putative selenium metabolism hydrolase
VGAVAKGQIIDAVIDQERLIAACRDVVRIESLTGGEAKVARYAADLMTALAFDKVEIDANGNVIGIMAGDGSAPSVMLNGHLDHVPVGAMVDPFSAALVDAGRWGEEGQAIYGRGSCDMKCNVVAGIFAVAALKQAGLAPGGDVIIVADVEEETDSPKGVKSVVQRGLRADYGLSVEATCGDVYLGHRGKVEFDVRIFGRTAHASEPSNGVSAIHEAMPFIAAIKTYEQTLGNDPLLGAATVAITGLHSSPDNGTAVIPDLVRMRVDRRYVRGEGPDVCLAEIRGLLVQCYGESEGKSWTIALSNHYPLMFTPETSPIAQAAVQAVSDVTGRAPRIAAWRFGVNGTFMTEAGIPTIGIGPGNEIWAHTPEEHIGTRDIIQATRAIARAVATITQAKVKA